MKRLLNAAIIFCVCAVLVGIAWLISIGFYEIGLWPIGAILRVGAWAVAIFGLYWIVRHLVQGQEGIVRGEMERMQRKIERQSRDDRLDS